MTDEWASVRLKAACTKIGSGATPRGGSRVYLQAGPYALIRSQNVRNEGFRLEGLAYIGEEHAAELANVEVFQDDVLLNITGDSVARACQVDPSILPARVNQHVAIIRPDPHVLDARFLRYALISPGMQARLLSWAGAGGTRNALTKEIIESLEIYAPADIETQQTIAQVLASLDDKIELNDRISRALEATAEGVFRSWFIDFEPVRAKADGRALKVSSDIAYLFPNRLVGDPPRACPEGWKRAPLGEEFDITMGQSPPGETYNEIGLGLPFYQGRADFAFRYPAVRVYCSQPTRYANAGDALLSVRAPVGSLNMAAERCAIGRGVAALRHKSSSRSYTYYLLRTLNADFVRFDAEGTVFGSVNRKDLNGIQHIVPSEGLILAFERLVAPLDARIEMSARESRTLAELRDLLVANLMSGKVRMRDPGEPKSQQSVTDPK